MYRFKAPLSGCRSCRSFLFPILSPRSGLFGGGGNILKWYQHHLFQLASSTRCDQCTQNSELMQIVAILLSWTFIFKKKSLPCLFFLRISTPLLLGEGRRNHVWWAHAKNSSICKLFSYWQLMSIPGFETREFVWFDVPLRRISVQTAHFGQSRWLLFPVVSLFVSGKEKTSETSSKMQGILHSENQEVELFRGFWNDFRSWRWLSSSYWELF